jgi:3-oxoacid CoA-transferase subunit A
MDKTVATAAEAVADIPDGASLAVGGFGLCGLAEGVTADQVREKTGAPITVPDDVGSPREVADRSAAR